MKSRKKELFLFTLIDYKAMEEYFEKKALEGWMISKINTFTMEFKKIEPKKLKFFVDIHPYISPFESHDEEAIENHRNIFEKRGWKFLLSCDKLQIFFCDEEDNIPSKKIEELEDKDILKKAFFSLEVLPIFILIPVLLLSLRGLFPISYDKLFTNTSIATTVMLPLLLIPVLIYAFYYGFWFLKARKHLKKGISIPKTSLKSALVRGFIYYILIAFIALVYLVSLTLDIIGGFTFPIFFLLVPIIGIGVVYYYKKKNYTSKRGRTKNIMLFTSLLLMITMLVSIFAIGMIISNNRFVEAMLGMKNELPEKYEALKLKDFGIDKEPRVKRFSQKSSIIVPESYEYHELSTEGKIRTYYYKAVNSDVADYIYEGMLKEEGSLMYREIIKAPEQTWNSERAFYLKEDRSMIILLKENTVILIDGDMDLSNQNIIEISVKKLEI